MCLDTITRTFAGRSRKVVLAYKAFRVADDGTLRFEYGSLNGSRIALTGRWLTAGPTEHLSYKAGFHVFPTQSQAESWGCMHISSRPAVYRVVRVRCQGLLLEGNDMCNGPAKVFQKLYIPRQKKNV